MMPREAHMCKRLMTAGSILSWAMLSSAREVVHISVQSTPTTEKKSAHARLSIHRLGDEIEEKASARKHPPVLVHSYLYMQ